MALMISPSVISFRANGSIPSRVLQSETHSLSKTSVLSYRAKSCIPTRALQSETSALSKTSSSISSQTPLKSRLLKGEKLLGLLLFSASPTMGEIASLAGFDFVVVDLEHGQGDGSDALHCLRAIEAAGASTVIRVPETTAACTKRALDLGPDGIMFPKIESAEAAKAAVAFSRYPPFGLRGCAYSLVRQSSYGFDRDYLRKYSDILLMCQVETEIGITNIKDIIQVEGLDCITTGPRDLSASIGLLHSPESPEVTYLTRKLEKEVLDSDPTKGGAFLAGMATATDSAIDLKNRGYHVVLGASDIGLFAKAALEVNKAFKKN